MRRAVGDRGGAVRLPLPAGRFLGPFVDDLVGDEATDEADLAELPRADDPLRGDVCVDEARVLGDGQRQAALAGEPDQLARLVLVDGERLLEVDLLSRLERRPRDLVVNLVGQEERDGVDAVVGQDLAVVVDPADAEVVGDPRGLRRVDVADDGDLSSLGRPEAATGAPR